MSVSAYELVFQSQITLRRCLSPDKLAKKITAEKQSTLVVFN